MEALLTHHYMPDIAAASGIAAPYPILAALELAGKVHSAWDDPHTPNQRRYYTRTDQL